jgi:hypothetical protein
MTPPPLSEAEVEAACVVGRHMLKGMRATKLPRDAQIRAAIHALAAIGSMETPNPSHRPIRRENNG